MGVLYPRGDDRLSGQAHQLFQPTPIVLARMGGTGAGQKKMAFRVPTPDSRLRVRLDVFFSPAAGVTPVPSGLTNLFGIWLYSTVLDRGGVSGRTIPVENVEGTEAALTTFPEADGLMGYSREFVTAADFIEGQANVGALSPNAIYAGATWILQTRYQPNNVTFSAREWNEITAQCIPILNDVVFTVP
jgi:hypothetical protein